MISFQSVWAKTGCVKRFFAPFYSFSLLSFVYFISECFNIVRMCDKICCFSSRSRLPFKLPFQKSATESWNGKSSGVERRRGGDTTACLLSLQLTKTAPSSLTMVAQKVISSSRSSEGTSALIVVSEKDSTHFSFLRWRSDDVIRLGKPTSTKFDDFFLKKFETAF